MVVLREALYIEAAARGEPIHDTDSLDSDIESSITVRSGTVNRTCVGEEETVITVIDQWF